MLSGRGVGASDSHDQLYPTDGDPLPDTCGQREELTGRSIRKYSGSSRPPGMCPEQWQLISKRRNMSATTEYKSALVTANRLQLQQRRPRQRGRPQQTRTGQAMLMGYLRKRGPTTQQVATAEHPFQLAPTASW